MPRPMITEWMSMLGYALHVKKEHSFTAAVSFPILFSILLLFLGFLMWRSRWREITPSVVLLTGVTLAVKHVRHLMLFYVFAAVYLPVCLRLYVADLSSRPGLRAFWQRPRVQPTVFALMLATTLSLGVNFVWRGPLQLSLPAYAERGVTGMYYPHSIFAYLEREKLSGRLLVEFVWGEYVLWRFHPRLTVALDGRFETVYPPEVIDDYFTFYYARPGWQRFLERYRPDLILIKDGGRLPQLLQGQGAWRVLHQEPGAVLLGPSQ